MKAMPRMLAERPQRSVKEEMIGILRGTSARRWLADSQRLLSLAAGLPG
jgi:hypothetical protein